MKDTAIIIVHIKSKGITRDVEVPLDITANELVIGLNSAYEKLLFKDGESNCINAWEQKIKRLWNARLFCNKYYGGIREEYGKYV